MNFATLAEALAARRTSRNSITYIEGENSERSLVFDAIHRRALGLLHHFQSHGVGPGTEMVLLLDSNEQFVDAFWACVMGGIIAVPVAPGTTDEHRHKVFRVLRQLGRPFLCSNEKAFARLTAYAEAGGLLEEIGQLRSASILLDQVDDISTPGRVHAAQPEDIVFIQYSSGSTSDPKGVVLSHRNLLANIRAIAQGMLLDAGDTALSWMPLTHDMGLIGFHLTWLVMDIAHHLMPTALFVRRPSLWLVKASEKRTTILCSPNFGYKHFLRTHERGKTQQLDLSSVRLIFNGAEPISIELCEQFMTALAPTGLKATAMFPVYGLAEASLAVTFPAPGVPYHRTTVLRHSLGLGRTVVPALPGTSSAVTLACVGRPVDQCEVRVATEKGEQLPDMAVGRILIRGANVTRGYYRNPEATRAVVCDDGWLDTGDLGFMCGQGLVVTGRVKEVIFVNGQNYYPQDIEALLEKHADIELGKAAVIGSRAPDTEVEEIVAFVLHRGPLEAFLPLMMRVRRCMSEQLGIAPDHVLPVNRMPKTTSGKVQRYLLARGYEAGEFGDTTAELRKLTGPTHEAAAAPGSEIERNLKEICNQHLKDKPIGVNDNIFELGTSSLTLAQIYQDIESTYPGRIEVTDFFDYPTIAELARYMEKRLADG